MRLGWHGSEDEQPLCASAAHKPGWPAVDELGDLSIDDTGWQDVPLQDLVFAPADAAEPQGGQLDDFQLTRQWPKSA